MKEGIDMELELSEVIKEDRIKLNMKATNKEEALAELTDLLYDSGILLEKDSFLKDVYLRETEGMTGIGNGIAIPHGKSKFVKNTSLAFGRIDKGIKWETLDGEPVKFIVLFAVDEADKTSTHVKLLAKVAGKLANEKVCKDLVDAKTSEEVLQIFSGR